MARPSSPTSYGATSSLSSSTSTSQRASGSPASTTQSDPGPSSLSERSQTHRVLTRSTVHESHLRCQDSSDVSNAEALHPAVKLAHQHQLSITDTDTSHEFNRTTEAKEDALERLNFTVSTNNDVLLAKPTCRVNDEASSASLGERGQGPSEAYAASPQPDLLPMTRWQGLSEAYAEAKALKPDVDTPPLIVIGSWLGAINGLTNNGSIRGVSPLT